MKKIKLIATIIFVLALLLVSIGAGYLYLFQKTDKFLLVKESGAVFYKLPNEIEYSELTLEEIELPAGTYVKTDVLSYARVFLPDNSLISLDEKTELQINYTSQKVSIKQLVGKTWNRVEALSKGQEYEVETPNTIAAVRGTIFGVGVDNDQLSRVFVEEHKVGISRFNETEILETQDLEESDIAQIIKDETQYKILKEKIGDDLKNSLWYKRNKLVDEEYKKLKQRRFVLNFRKTLQNNLEKRSEFTEYRLGLKANLPKEEIKDQLADVYDISKISEKTCSNYSQASIQDAINKVRAYRNYINKANEIESLLINLKDTCLDSEMNLNEAVELETQVNQINSSN